MKKCNGILILLIAIFWLRPAVGQDCYNCPSGTVMDNTDLIFEGRILTDSVYYQNSPGRIYTFHKVLVLKQFKGYFKTDTLRIVTFGGKMIMNGQSEGTPGAYAFKGDEAVIFATVMKLGNQDPDLYYILYGAKGGFTKICEKKDPVKEVYEPLEKVIGRPYIELRPNTCKEWQEEQKKKPKPHVPMGPDGKPMSPSPSTN